MSDSRRGIGAKAAYWAQRFVPDPLVLAIGLALVLAIAVVVRSLGIDEASGAARMSVLDVAETFAAGMLHGPLLIFAFQMALILVTGHALADAAMVREGLQRLARIPKDGAQAAVLVAFFAMALGLLNWGLGLVAGAFLARSVGEAFAERGDSDKLNYPLVGAAGYLGLSVWHGGLSGSAPLKAAAPDGAFGHAIAVSDTVFSTMNITICLALVLALCALIFVLAKGGRDPEAVSFAPQIVPLSSADEDDAGHKSGVVHNLETRRWFSVVLAAPILIYLGRLVLHKGLDALNLNTMILGFLALGLLAHRGLGAFARSFSAGTSGAAGILLQFPIYFGILALAKSSGLVTDLARALSALSPSGDAASFWGPFWTFLGAGAVNIIVPSGGGQWVLQAPILVEASQTLNVSEAKMLLAFCYGDQLTNLAQPFWALPLLAITGLKARDVMGYTLVCMAAAFGVVTLGLLIF